MKETSRVSSSGSWGLVSKVALGSKSLVARITLVPAKKKTNYLGCEEGTRQVLVM